MILIFLLCNILFKFFSKFFLLYWKEGFPSPGGKPGLSPLKEAKERKGDTGDTSLVEAAFPPRYKAEIISTLL